jgi:hypothetical protein
MSTANLLNAQRRQHKVNVTKVAVLFTQHFCWNFTAYFNAIAIAIALSDFFAYFGQIVLLLKTSKII